MTNERFRKKDRHDSNKNEHSHGAKYVEDGKYVEEDSGMNKVKVQSKFWCWKYGSEGRAKRIAPKKTDITDDSIISFKYVIVEKEVIELD